MKASLFAILILVNSPVFAQTGTIRGNVKDKAGIPIPQANIIIQKTSLEAFTDQDGYYLISNIKPGKYTIQFSSVSKLITIVSSACISTNLEIG